MAVPRPLDRAARADARWIRARLARILATWAIVFALFALVFIANYSVLPAFDHRYRAVFYPGDRLAEELARALPRGNRQAAGLRDRQHVGRRQCRPLRARAAARPDRRQPRRAPWIDLGDLRSKGAVVVWTDGDPGVIPVGLRRVAADAQVQPPFALPFRRGDGVVRSAGQSCGRSRHSRLLKIENMSRT